MADRQFLQLLNAYLANPRVPLALPASVELQNALFDQAKVYIRNSLYSSQVADAQHAVELAWAIAGQTGLDEHRALASWCSGLLHANRDVRKSSRHLEEALAYYRQAHKAEEEGRLLFGYASQLNLLGRLEEAEQAVQRSIECLAATPDYRDWPLIYINLAYIQGQRGRYVEMLASARQAEEMAIRFEAKVAEHAMHYRLLQAQALINQAYAYLFLGQLIPAEEVLRRAQHLAREGNSAEIAGRASVNLARLLIQRGNLFAALHTLNQARDEFATAQIEIDQATVAIETAALYERLMMPHKARQAAMQAAAAFERAGIPAESVEARLLAIRLSLTLNEPKRAARFVQEAQTLTPQAPPLLQVLWRGYAAHPLLQKTKQQHQQGLAQAEEAWSTLHQLGAVAESLDVALIAAELAATLGRLDAHARFTRIAETANQQGLSALERQACLGLANLQGPAAAVQTLQRAAQIARSERQQMPVEAHAPQFVIESLAASGLARYNGRLIEVELGGAHGVGLSSIRRARRHLQVALAMLTTTTACFPPPPTGAGATSSFAARCPWVPAMADDALLEPLLYEDAVQLYLPLVAR